MEYLSNIWEWLNNFDNLILMAVVAVGLAILAIILVGVIIVGLLVTIWTVAQATILNPAFWIVAALLGYWYYVATFERSWAVDVDPEFIEACSGNEACNRELRRIDKYRLKKESDSHQPLEVK